MKMVQKKQILVEKGEKESIHCCMDLYLLSLHEGEKGMYFTKDLK